MSVYRFTSTPHTPFCSIYIDAFELVVTNNGSKGFDLLVQGTSGGRSLIVSLTHMEPAPAGTSVYKSAEVRTDGAPFELQLVTNIACAPTTSLLLFAKQMGQTVAIATNADFVIGG